MKTTGIREEPENGRPALVEAGGGRAVRLHVWALVPRPEPAPEAPLTSLWLAPSRTREAPFPGVQRRANLPQPDVGATKPPPRDACAPLLARYDAASPGASAETRSKCDPAPAPETSLTSRSEPDWAQPDQVCGGSTGAAVASPIVSAALARGCVSEGQTCEGAGPPSLQSATPDFQTPPECRQEICRRPSSINATRCCNAANSPALPGGG